MNRRSTEQAQVEQLPDDIPRTMSAICCAPSWGVGLCLIMLVAALCSCGQSNTGTSTRGNTTNDSETVRIAVASNFATTFDVLAEAFENEYGHRVERATASTGKHYAQIRNGAPYAAFFAADSDRPRRLEAEGYAVARSRFTYALGRLVLWTRDPDQTRLADRIIEAQDFNHLAIANPDLAPYGTAARQVLQAWGVYDALQHKLARGENVSQAMQFARSGNAEYGFVALSQVLQLERDRRGSYWIVPDSLYDPIEQQAILLREGPIAEAFAKFVQSGPSRVMIKSRGYALPISRP